MTVAKTRTAAWTTPVGTPITTNNNSSSSSSSSSTTVSTKLGPLPSPPLSCFPVDLTTPGSLLVSRPLFDVVLPVLSFLKVVLAE